MLVRTIKYTDWDKAQEDMKKAGDIGFDSYMIYNVNEKVWNVTYKTLEA